ncbi:hypothetical protein [Cohnella sp. GbtcB17]|uniref:hypothetical protein n=1 Tax=Cohnella sp. GbtcB17 TaxID=2824762 RepID=UPI001C2FAA03|nr:hypothetical protein [Cohnella sp. GbtcB17]
MAVVPDPTKVKTATQKNGTSTAAAAGVVPNPASNAVAGTSAKTAVPDPFAQYGGKEKYAASQNERWQAANQSNNTELMGKLIADSKRAGYTLNPYSAPAAQPSPAAADYSDWKTRTTDLFNKYADLASGSFQYDANTDPKYLAQQQLVKQRAGVASQSAMEDLNSRGILNSSVTGSQLAQIQQNAEQEALAYVPQYEAMARQDYQDKLANAGNLLNIALGREDTAYNRNYQTQRDARADSVDDRNYNRGVLESDRAFDRGVLESDRSYEYQKARDVIADKNYQKTFDENVRQFGLTYGLQKAAQDHQIDNDAAQLLLAQDDNDRQWSQLDWQMSQQPANKSGMSANDVLSNVKSLYTEPVYTTEKDMLGNVTQKQTGEQLTKDPAKREQMFLNVVDSGLTDLETNQVLAGLGMTKQEIDQYKKKYGATSGN